MQLVLFIFPSMNNPGCFNELAKSVSAFGEQFQPLEAGPALQNNVLVRAMSLISCCERKCNQHLTRMAPRSSKEFAEIAKSFYNFLLVNTNIKMPQIDSLFEFQLNLSYFRSDTLSHVLCPPSETVLRIAEWRYVPLFTHLKT